MRAIVIFAGGQGTRMLSPIPKVMHTIAHKSMLSYVYDAAITLDPAQIVLVSSPQLQSYFETHPKAVDIPIEDITIAVQHPAHGTGHAMQVAMDALHRHIDEVLVLYGDVPFISPNTLDKLTKSRGDMCFLGINVPPPHAYGRMTTKGDRLLKITEDKEASFEEKAINYVWSGVLRANVAFLKKALPLLPKSETTGEYYLTSIIELFPDADVTHLVAEDAAEFEGINDKFSLSLMEEKKQNQMRQRFLEQGVKMIDPKSAFFAHDTVIEPDATLMPFITCGKGVHIKSGATVLSFCHLEDSFIESKATIGPFAHLRGGTYIGEGAYVGNFIEVKKTTMKSWSKAKHMAYLGDAEIGEKVNIGVGTVTCNYDGKKKSKTLIGDRCFIGANSTLIAPVEIKHDACVGAGSVITEDVPAHSLALGRARQVIKNRKG